MLNPDSLLNLSLSLWSSLSLKILAYVSGHVRPRQATEICNFGEVSPLDFLQFSLVDRFSVFLQVFCVA